MVGDIFGSRSKVTTSYPRSSDLLATEPVPENRSRARNPLRTLLPLGTMSLAPPCTVHLAPPSTAFLSKGKEGEAMGEARGGSGWDSGSLVAGEGELGEGMKDGEGVIVEGALGGF